MWCRSRSGWAGSGRHRRRMPEAKDKLDGSVKFYLAGQATPAVIQKLGQDVSNRKTNGVGQKDRCGCKWVALSAPIAAGQGQDPRRQRRGQHRELLQEDPLQLQSTKLKRALHGQLLYARFGCGLTWRAGRRQVHPLTNRCVLRARWSKIQLGVTARDFPYPFGTAPQAKFTLI